MVALWSDFSYAGGCRLKEVTLEKNRIVVNVRRSRGKDIDAACGQLANKS